MFDPSMWSRGYATETARAFLAIGFRRHDPGDGRLVDLRAISREIWEVTEVTAKMHIG